MADWETSYQSVPDPGTSILSFRPLPVHDVGDLVERDGAIWVVLARWPRISRFGKKDQTTRIEGYTYGLKKVSGGS